MTTLSFESLGISKEDLTEKLLDRLVEEFTTEVTWDEDGEQLRRSDMMVAKITAQIKEHIDATIRRLGDEHVLPRVTEIVEGLVIQQTNTWGEKKGTPVTFIEYLVSRADAYMREDVDLNGKSKDEPGGYGWSKYTTRITYLVNSHLKYSIDAAMKQALMDANKGIVGGLESAVKHALAEAQAKLRVDVRSA